MAPIGMDRRSPSRGALAAAVVLLACALAGLLFRPHDAAARVRRPITLRIEGFLDAAPEGVRSQRTVEVRIGRDLTRSLAVTRVVNQGAGPHGQTILGEAARYRPAFRLRGDDALIAKLGGAAKGSRVTLTGNLSSARNVLLTIVDVEPAAVAPPAAAPAASPVPAASPGAGG